MSNSVKFLALAIGMVCFLLGWLANWWNERQDQSSKVGSRRKIADLSAQVEAKAAGYVMQPEELADVARVRREHKELNDTQNEIAIWLRENKKEEIRRGDHRNRTLPDIVIGYMSKAATTTFKEPVQ